MDKYRIYINSEIESQVLINGFSIGCIEPPFFTLLIESDEPSIIVSINPLQRSTQSIFISQTIKLTFLNGKLFSNENYCELFSLEHNAYILKITPQSQNVKVINPPLSKTINDTIVSVHNNILQFSNSKNQVFYPLEINLCNINIEQQNELTFFCANTIENKKFALVLNKSLQILFETTADKIEFDGRKIISLNRLDTIANHGRVDIFSYNENGFRKDDSYLVYLDKFPIPPASSQVYPLAFLEAIQLKDLALARNYLHPNLNTILNDSTLTSFFGNFSSFFPVEFAPSVKLALTYDVHPKHVRYFNFEISNNLISNIQST